MGKWNAVGFGQDLADEAPSDTIIGYDGPVPPKGVYRFNLKRLEATESKAGAPMMKCVLEIAEPSGTKKAQYNGASGWLYRTCEKENANRVNQFLLAILAGTKLTDAKQKAVLKAFWAGNVVTEGDGEGMIKKIGTWNVPDSIEVAANTSKEKYEGDEQLRINSLIPITDAPKPVVADEDDEELEDEEYDDEEAEEDDAEPEDDDAEEEGEDDELEERRAELEGMSRTELKKIKPSDLRVTTKVTDNDIIEAILEAEFPLEDEEEPEDEDELEDEPEEEDDEEEEPEPAKPARRAPSGRGKSAPAAKARPAAKRRAKTDEPPF